VSVKKSRDIEGVRNKTKTPAGMRVLPMTPDVESMLKRRRAILSDQFEAHGRDLVRKKKDGTAVVLTENTPICCDSMGRRTNVHSVSSQWRKIRGMLDLDDYTPHELRHSYLSMLYANGCDLKVLQKIAGHSRYSTTADIYVHTTLDDMRSAMSI
jgi:integrase